MNSKTRYSGLLSDILENNYSDYLYPPECLGNFKKLNNGPKEFDLLSYNNQFSLGLPTPTGIMCTCLVQCTCAPRNKPISSKIESLTRETVFAEPTCICGTCFCKPKQLRSNELTRLPPTHFDNGKCICSVCLCKDKISSTNLFPYPFRNAIKLNSQKLMTDEMMKKEFDEIKLLLNDYENSKKMEPEMSTKPEKQSDSATTPSNKDHDLTESTKRLSPISKASQEVKVSFDEAITQNTKTDITSKTKEKSARKKIKLNKHPKVKTTSCRKTCTLKKKALNIRYYYSGGTEHYGVRLGHKTCLNKPGLVPKHMGWLWNIEDLTKGIRERKGWPPGFIGGNIMQLLRLYKTDRVSTEKLPERKRWTSSRQTVQPDNKEPTEEPPLLHILKKGRTYNITFCPKSSDQDMEPIPIPFTITGNKHDDDTESSNSTLELEFHSPKPQLQHTGAVVPAITKQNAANQDPLTIVHAPSTTQQSKQAESKMKKKKSKWFEDNKISWEEQETHIQNIS